MKYCRETSSWSKSKWTILLVTMSVKRRKPVTAKTPLTKPLCRLLEPGLPALRSPPQDRPTGRGDKAQELGESPRLPNSGSFQEDAISRPRAT